ncbi:MAG: class I SAM-dependent methyltransferase [bacterium]|nr:class I SAM-dependent methyltransferase [bacterium]
MNALSPEMEDAYIADLQRVFPYRPGVAVLDAGAGTGTMSNLLLRMGYQSITALEPSSGMLRYLRERVEPRGVSVVEGFCDSEEDRSHFDGSRFDLILSRQLANELFDPLMAFQNWHLWLVRGGSLIVMDGLFDRAAWVGPLEGEVDILPLASNQSAALVPYLLEKAGFEIQVVEPMSAVNGRSGSRYVHHVVRAVKT